MRNWVIQHVRENMSVTTGRDNQVAEREFEGPGSLGGKTYLKTSRFQNRFLGKSYLGQTCPPLFFLLIFALQNRHLFSCQKLYQVVRAHLNKLAALSKLLSPLIVHKRLTSYEVSLI
jgi:hypothetical protein